MLQFLPLILPILLPLIGGYAMKVIIDSSVSGFSNHFNEMGGFNFLIIAFILYLAVTGGALKNFLSAPANAQVVVIAFFVFCFVFGKTAYSYKRQKDSQKFLESLDANKTKRVTNDDLQEHGIKVNKEGDFSLIFLVQKIEPQNETYYTNMVVFALKRANSLEVNKRFQTGEYWKKSTTLFSAALSGGHLELVDKIIENRYFNPLVNCTAPNGLYDCNALEYFFVAYPEPATEIELRVLKKLANKTKKELEKKGSKFPFRMAKKLKKVNINI